MSKARDDKELAQYRDLLETPTEFKDGFGWSTVIGMLFCGLVMMPGSIYLSLMTGGSLASAATWVTVVLFNEVIRRAMKSMSRQQLVVLLYAAGSIMWGGPMGDFVYRAFLVSSDAVRDAGMRDYFPTWWVPKPNSPAILERNLFHHDWLVPAAFIAVMFVIGFLSKYTLGYFFFRLASDVEKLPFPMAPIHAQGAMALAEADEPAAPSADVPSKDDSVLKRFREGARKKSERWRLFSLGVSLGVAFGFIQVGIPAITGLLFDKPVFLLPQPFVDTTTVTEKFLPATPTGLTLDMGIVLIGFVIPFWACVGTFVAIMATMIVNPILHHAGVITTWQPGMDTINTSFSNGLDFWMSFGIGAAFGIAIVSFYQTIRDVRLRMKQLREARREAGATGEAESLWATPRKGRGDYPVWIALVGYVVISLFMIGFCYYLLKDTGTSRIGILIFLLIFTFVYNPLISYVNARLLGISGQSVDIPFLKETSFILSGAKGVEVWLAPIPISNYGYQAQSFRVNELTGVSMWSLVKLDLVAMPVVFILSWAFWGFIWHATPIPSDAFPAVQIQWELRTKQDALLYTSTFAAEGQKASIMDSQFMKAVHPVTVGAGMAVTVLMFALLSVFGLPTLFVYGVIRGLGGLPHYLILEIVGAMIGRYYFQKKFGSSNFLRMAPTVLAGYATGVGLISMATIAMRLIQSAVSSSPF